MRRVRVVLVGAGRWGSVHAKTVREAGGELVAVVDVDRRAAERLASLYGARAYTSLADSLAEKPDAALVVVPPEHLYSVAVEAVEYGLHVLVEKPVALDSRSALDLAARVERRGLVGIAGYLLRFHPVVRLAARLVAESGVWLFEAKRLVHRRSVARTRPIDIDLAVHDIDLALYLLGAGLRDTRASLERVDGGSVFRFEGVAGNARVEVLASDAVPEGVRHRVLSLYGSGLVYTADFDEGRVVVKRRGRVGEERVVQGEPPLTVEHRVFYAMVARVEGLGEERHPLEAAAASIRDAALVLRVLEEARRG